MMVKKVVIVEVTTGVGNSLKHDENVIFFLMERLSAGAFIRRGFFPAGILSVGAFIRWGFFPWGFYPRGFCPTLIIFTLLILVHTSLVDVIVNSCCEFQFVVLL